MKFFQWLWQQPALLVTLTCLFWGGNTIAAKIAVDDITPYQVTFGRWGLLSITLFLCYRRQIQAAWPILRPYRVYLFLMPAIGFVVFGFLFYEAGHRTTAINIGILQGSVPIFVLIGAFLLYRTRITWLQIAGVMVGFLGVVTVATGGLPGVMSEIQLNTGDLMMIGACLVWASYTIGLKKRPAIPGLILFAVFCIPAAFVSAPFAIFELASGHAPWPTLTGGGVLLYTTVFPSFLAQLFFLRGVDLMGPGRTGMFVNLTPIFAALLAVGILRETFHIYHAVALVLVLAGLWLSRDRSIA